ncbi:MAG TPA: PQQ-binding-like beta-propeller repeat protein, partial [Gemmataceae bacterium]|nr:PQQ-binding-like beta-propeller repeat protein [Gemmataceae bacterium]
MSTRGGNEVVWALSERNGKELWVTPLAPARRQRMPQGREGPGCTPTVDGDRLYVLGLGGKLACLRVRDGKILWHKDLVRDFGGRPPVWSYRESPLVDGDKVVVTPGGRQATLVALNKKTGAVIWKSQVPGGPGAAYASAIAIDCAGKRQYVQFTQRGVVGVAADTGKFLWRYDRPANRMGINCSTPIYHDGEIFAASAYNAGGGLVRLAKTEDGIQPEEVYATRYMQNHHGGMILLNGYLYGANGGNGGGWLYCLDFNTGKVMWDSRKVPKGSV